MSVKIATFNVGSNPVEIFASNQYRKYAIVTNLTDVDCFLAIGTNAIAGIGGTTAIEGMGIPLLSKGSSYEITNRGNANFVSVSVKAVGTGGTVILATQEI